MVSRLDRDSLLQYKPKIVMYYMKTFMINNKFDNNILNFKKLTKKTFSNLRDVNPLFKDYKIRVINSMQNNIASLKVNNFKFPNC